MEFMRSGWASPGVFGPSEPRPLRQGAAAEGSQTNDPLQKLNILGKIFIAGVHSTCLLRVPLPYMHLSTAPI